ncbi:MAG: cobalamin-dependent protein [Spirochaetes bacterium]|nr:cobalamin-dependent protein [Spirochaetota bacterium]
MKIVLFYACDIKDRHNYYLSMMPINFAALGAYLESKKHKVTMINFSKIDKTAGMKKLTSGSPDLIITTMFSHNRFETIRLVRELKKNNPRYKIAVSGPLATFLVNGILERWTEVDFILRDEPESSVEFLLEKLSSGKNFPEKVFQGQRIKNLSKIVPPPFFSGDSLGIDHNEQYKFLMSSRGVLNANRYFTSPEYRDNKIIFRTPDEMVRQIDFIYKKYGIVYFSIKDDNFTVKKDRVIDFCRKLRKKHLYLMWNCKSRPEMLDEEMLVEMKLAGLERILLTVNTGSVKLLDSYDSEMKTEDILRATALIRKTGIYYSEIITVGYPDETKSDINHTKRIIKQTLPGNVIIMKAIYFPGSFGYESAKLKGIIDDSVWFKAKDSIITVNSDETDLKAKFEDIRNTAGLVREGAWYKEKDFKNHHRVLARQCWVTDILEGDYYMDEENHAEAEKSYRRVISAFPKNPWGYLRQGKVKFRLGDFAGAQDYYHKVTELVPNFYGGWLKMSESEIAEGNRKKAKSSIEKAYSLNRFDHRIHNIKTLLK